MSPYQQQFPKGTPVCVTQTIAKRSNSIRSSIVGVVEEWEEQPTGSWFAHGRGDNVASTRGAGDRVASTRCAGEKLWLKRLKLRKVDGELTLVVIDDETAIAKLEAVSDPPSSD